MISDILILKIFPHIHIKTGVKYIPFGDGEQNYTIFYKKILPYALVSKSWAQYFKDDYINI